MRQQQFEARYAPFWDALAQTLTHLEQPSRHRWWRNTKVVASAETNAPAPVAPKAPGNFPADYRRLCHHLALARQRGYSPNLIQRLNALVLRGHRQLYQHRPPLLPRLRDFVRTDFPRAVRGQWRWHAASGLSFILAMALIWGLLAVQPERVHSVLSGEMIADVEAMYASDTRLSDGRGSEDDVMMFGYYIYNNISIAFRSFAGGLFFGVGALFIMIFNGGFFGAVAGHLTNVGAGHALFTFVIAHGAPEITAIILAGGAGLRLGAALLSPGQLTRLAALRAAARSGLPVIYGVFLLLVLAAFIEAFWSPRDLPAHTKYLVGGLCWALLSVYLLFGGRTAKGDDDAPR